MMSSNDSPLLIEREGALLEVTLNRPQRLNAVSLEMYVALASSVSAAAGDRDVRAIVLTGAGRAFCAGADLKAHAESDPTDGERRRYARAAQAANLALQRVPVPVVAAVNGAAVGAGLELALSCDFIVVADDAKLRLPELVLGTFYGGGVSYTLPQRVGLAKAKELLFLGEFFSGAEAAAMGLVNRAVPGATVLEESRSLAQRLAAAAPFSVAFAKRLLNDAARTRRTRTLRAEAAALSACMRTEDWKEGIAAFREKRPPRFRGQ